MRIGTLFFLVELINKTLNKRDPDINRYFDAMSIEVIEKAYKY
jgi:hypothetical protein